MGDFVNKIKTKDGVEYDIQDKRLNVTAADAGKVVTVDENGNLVLAQASSGGTKLYEHDLSYQPEGVPVTEHIRIITRKSSAYTFAEIQALATKDIINGYSGGGYALAQKQPYTATFNFVGIISSTVSWISNNLPETFTDTVTEL